MTAADSPGRPAGAAASPARHASPARREGAEVGARLRDFRAGRHRAERAPGDQRRGDGGAERAMVPPADFTSYYGRPIVKAPVWHHDIAAYLFTGGLAAGSSLIAAGADVTGRPVLRRTARTTALAALAASTYFLVNDLGQPKRFHHMLRVAKPTSPMSVGTWILSTYGPMAGLAAVAEAAPLLPGRGVLGAVRRVLPFAGRAAGFAAAGLAPGLATYTAVLLADTATPSWHEAYPELPFVFAGSALASASGIGLMFAPSAEAGPLRPLVAFGAGLELVGAHRVETTLGLLSEPYRLGRAGRLLRAGRNLTAAGTAGALLGRRSRVLSVLSGACLAVAAVCTRFGIFEGGVASARDPKYTVVPQRERLAARDGGQDDRAARR